MVTFKPKKNNELSEKYQSDLSALGYIAYDEDGKECGFITFCLNGYSMEITDIDVCNGDDEIYEGLMRSALNYCGNRNAYTAYYSSENALNVAEMLGFEQQGDKLYGEIPFLLQGTCCRGKQDKGEKNND